MMSLFCSLPCYSRSAEFMLSYCGHTTCCSYYTSPFSHGEEKDKNCHIYAVQIVYSIYKSTVYFIYIMLIFSPLIRQTEQETFNFL